jgi:hypothetical protein
VRDSHFFFEHRALTHSFLDLVFFLYSLCRFLWRLRTFRWSGYGAVPAARASAIARPTSRIAQDGSDDIRLPIVQDGSDYIRVPILQDGNDGELANV